MTNYDDTYKFEMRQHTNKNKETKIIIEGEALHIAEIIEDFKQWLIACTFTECQLDEYFKDLEEEL